MVLPGCVPTSVTLPLDILHTANCIQETRGNAAKTGLFDIALVGARKGLVRAVNGLGLQAEHGFSARKKYDLIITPSFSGPMDQVLAENQAALRFLALRKEQGALLASSCTGSFLLAAAGVLDGLKATTHWNYFDRFRDLFPDIPLDTEHMVVAHKNIYCAAGSTAAGDLALFIVGKYLGADTARRAARMLLLDVNRPREAYAGFPAVSNHPDDSIREAQEYMQRKLKADVNVADAADHVGLSRRQFTRRFLNAVGDHPLQYIQKLKVEHARERLELSEARIDAIAFEVGYENMASFRKVFKEQTGISPSEYRRRFQR